MQLYRSWPKIEKSQEREYGTIGIALNLLDKGPKFDLPSDTSPFYPLFFLPLLSLYVSFAYRKKIVEKSFAFGYELIYPFIFLFILSV